MQKVYSRPKDDSFESFKQWFTGFCRAFSSNSDEPIDEGKLQQLYAKYKKGREEFDARHLKHVP
jgi:hypothetical protein